jgi:hypothetical protein
VDVRRNGRQRRVRLSGPEVARALEGLAAIAAPSTDVHSLSEATARDQLAAARTCYDHLAGSSAWRSPKGSYGGARSWRREPRS